MDPDFCRDDEIDPVSSNFPPYGVRCVLASLKLWRSGRDDSRGFSIHRTNTKSICAASKVFKELPLNPPPHWSWTRWKGQEEPIPALRNPFVVLRCHFISGLSRITRSSKMAQNCIQGLAVFWGRHSLRPH